MGKTFIISFTLMLLLASISMSCNTQKINNDDPKIKEAELAVQKHLKKNYKDVESISFTNHEKNPMGVLMVRGYLNDDQSKKFSVHYDFNQKDIVVGIVNADPK
ncbi:DUF1433 domain-containing protein [Metabacillus indicus]|uniref:DUF1433 domain-containing protein n=1 Tax=Metabacillus indicus TaxID=246786 RepID=UPI00068C8D24|nr:DUF1433 domain-containing protein [Metabacillus indicus]